MIRASFTLIVLALLAGCNPAGQRPPVREEIVVPPPLPIPGPAKRVHPVRVDPRFPKSVLSAKLARGRDILGSYGVRIEYADLREIEAPQWLTIDESDYESLSAFAKGSGYVFLFVERIVANGVEVGGLGCSAWGACSPNSMSNVVAHEAGHGARLPHRDRPDNVLCSKGCAMDAVVFDADQVASLKRWATAKAATAKVADRPAVCGG